MTLDRARNFKKPTILEGLGSAKYYSEISFTPNLTQAKKNRFSKNLKSLVLKPPFLHVIPGCGRNLSVFGGISIEKVLGIH